MEPLRILLADDHALFRQGVKSLLEARPFIEVVGSAENGLEAIALAHETLPDVILMDVEMPHCDGLEATRQIKRALPHIKIIMLTVAEDDQTIYEAIRGGAQGYLLKDLEANQLYSMLEGLQRGEAPLSGEIAAKILEEFQRTAPSTGESLAAGIEPLSDREYDVLELVVRGHSNAEIAAALTLTENTVKTHLSNILTKLHLKNRIQAAVYAVSRGLVDPPPPEPDADQ